MLALAGVVCGSLMAGAAPMEADCAFGGLIMTGGCRFWSAGKGQRAGRVKDPRSVSMGQVGLVAGYPAGLRLSRDKQTLTGDVRHAKFNGTVAGPGRRGCQRRRAIRGAAHSE